MYSDIEIKKDNNGTDCVFINNIQFKVKQKDDWKEVENYLKSYIGRSFKIEQSTEEIFISSDFPDEFANSKSRIRLKGPLAKAKANIAMAIKEIIQIAKNPRHEENRKEKHKNDAKNGWYRYDTKFAIPVYDNDKNFIRYNFYNAILLVRHASDDKKYLYDIIGIKKETSSPLESNNDCTV